MPRYKVIEYNLPELEGKKWSVHDTQGNIRVNSYKNKKKAQERADVLNNTAARRDARAQ